MIEEYRMKKLFLVSLLVGLVLVGVAATYRYVGDHISEELLAQPGESVLQKTGLKVAEILRRAESGDAVMQYNLGQMFSEGEGVQKNEKTASSWLIRAADQGLVQAQAGIGARYLVGVGVPTDWNKGMSWLEKASMQEDPIVQMVLGALYLGQGPKAPSKFVVNYDRAFHWMLKSARNGFAAAQEVVSRMYADGIGTKADDKEAGTWLIKAAEGGSEAAMKNLATAYEQGILGFGKNLNLLGSYSPRLAANKIISTRQYPAACGGDALFLYFDDTIDNDLLVHPGESVIAKTGLTVAEILKRAESGDAV